MKLADCPPFLPSLRIDIVNFVFCAWLLYTDHKAKMRNTTLTCRNIYNDILTSIAISTYISVIIIYLGALTDQRAIGYPPIIIIT